MEERTSRQIASFSYEVRRFSQRNVGREMNFDLEERTIPTPLRMFGVRLHSRRLPVREGVSVLDSLGVDHSLRVVLNWMQDIAAMQPGPSTARATRVAGNEKQIKVYGAEKWLYAITRPDSQTWLEIDVYRS